MDVVRIMDAADGRIAAYAQLTDHQLRSRLRREQAMVIAESRIVVEVALKTGQEFVSMLIDERHLDALAHVTSQLGDDVPLYVASRDVMSQIVGFKVTRGIMAALRRPRELSADEVLRDARRVAVLDGLVDATNVGAIMRSAAAFGVDAVLLSPTCADPLSRRACRVSMGTVFQLPWVHLGEAEGEWGRWPEGALGSLRAAGFHVAAMALEDGATVLDDPALCEHERLALVFGTEGWGLSRRTLACCDECVIIPMAAGVDSLNVASSSAVAFWQLCR